MATAETARLVASLDLNTRKFDQGIRNATGSLGKLGGAIGRSRAVAVGLGVGLERVAEKGISALGNAIGDGIASAQALEKAQAQTQAVITSTGGAAGVSADQVRGLANALEDVTTADDKTIQQGENLLLTFTGIGKETFPRATKAMVNMAIALNKGDAATADFDGSAIQLGKALNDPVKGITALRKVGVSFTDQQVKQIKTLVKSGKTVQAQAVILAELEKEFGKAGAAAGTGFTADVNRARDAIEDAETALAQGLMPAIGEVARELSTELNKPEVQSSLKDLGKGLGEALKSAAAFVKSIPWDKVGQGLSIAAEGAKAIVSAFTSLPPWVQAAVISGWGLNKLTGGALGSVVGGIFGDLGKGLLQKLGLMRITAGVVQVSGPVSGLPGATGAAGVASKGLSTLAKVALIGETVGLVAAVFDVQQAVSAASSAQAAQIADQTSQFIASQPNQQQLETALAGVNQGIHDLEANPLNVLVQGDALDKLRGMRADLQKALASIPAFKPGQGSGVQGGAIDRMENRRGAVGDALFSAEVKALQASNIAKGPDIEALRGKVADGLSTLDTSTVVAGTATAAAATTAGVLAANASSSAGARVAAAIAANRPTVITNVYVSGTTVQQKATTTTRYGPSGSDRTGTGHAPGTGPLP